MKRIPLLAWCIVAVGLMAGDARAFTIDYWTGALPTGWAGGITPAASDSFYLGNAVSHTISLPGSLTANALIYNADGDEFAIDSPSPVTLSLTSGLIGGVGLDLGQLLFQPNVTLGLSGSPILDAGSNNIVVYNKVTGTASPTFLSTGSSTGILGAFLFVNSAGTNDYVGNTTVGDGVDYPTITFWSGSPFGTGTVTFLNGGYLIAHNTGTITNNLVLNTISSSNGLFFRSWDSPLTLSGSITLANSSTLGIQSSPAAIGFANGAGNLAIPGQASRNPVIITGNVGETGGARNLLVQGQGILVLAPASGSNTYTGGTNVGGSLIFGNNNAIPASGSVLVNGGGYVGFADVSAGNFATQVAAHVDRTAGGSTGAVGVDTLTGSPVTLTDNVDLSSTGLNFLNSGIRFGTATSAILTGTFKPQGSNYQFGNGGGSLYVQSNLANVSTSSQLQLNNTSQVPLKLYLQGTNNTYSGGTFANNGFVIFDGAGALPASGTLTAQTNNGTTPSQGIGSSYVGYTDAVGTTPAAFLAKFDKANTWGVIGFDTHAGSSTVTINGVDLTGFNNGVYLGTASSAILTGTLTPSTVTNGTNGDHTVWLTAGNGGTLTVNSTITDGGSPVGVVLGGRPSANPYFSNGTVIMNGANTYSFGTALNANNQGLTVTFGNNGAFGIGPITIWSGGSGLVGLQAGGPGLALANAITFQTYAALHLLGNNAFSLNGVISGEGSIEVQRAIGAPAGNVTLGGNNSSLTGEIDLQNSMVTLNHNNAAGQTQINLFDGSATLAFGSAATAPVLHGISGDDGHLILPNSVTTLTFQMDDNMNHDGDFGGTISAASGGPTSAALVVDANNNDTNQTLYLHGHNNYTGGTTIQGYGVLALGYADSAGSGAVTLNTTDGGLILNTGVIFTNALVLNSGGLAGLGAFAPSSVTGTNQSAGKITFGANQMVFAGIPGGDDLQMPGILTIQTNVTFLNGGTLREMIQDPAVPNVLNGSPATNVNGGYGLLDVQGTLDLSLLTTSFLIALESVDATYSRGISSQIILGQSYSLPFVKATSITGFDPTKFSFDPSEFQNGLMSSTVFNVSSDGTSLYLNFTAVPEPSTWALLATGLGFLGLRTRRRRT